jgi:hypothetical protein
MVKEDAYWLVSFAHGFLNRFIKKLTRNRVVRIAPAKASWFIFANTVSGTPSLPK